MEMKVQIKQMPQYHVAYVRKTGAYGKETCTAAFEELMQWAGPKGLCQSGAVLAAYWDDCRVVPAEKCRTDACIEVPDNMEVSGNVQLQDVPAGSYAVCSFELTQDQFPAAWEQAMAGVMSGGHQIREHACYELYHNDGSQDPDGKWRVDICIPVKQ